jgi:hypothetical protein
VITGRIRYAPAAGYVGADSFTYVVASGGKASQGRVGVAVAAAAGGDATQPKGVYRLDEPNGNAILSGDRRRPCPIPISPATTFTTMTRPSRT